VLLLSGDITQRATRALVERWDHDRHLIGA